MLLVDTDMLVLLIASGYLDQVAESLGFARDDIRCLPAAIHQVRRSASFRDTYGTDVLQRTVPQIEAVRVIETAKDSALLEQLNDCVDPGEAILIAAALEHDGSLLMSGDKRAVRALAARGPPACIETLRDRVVTLEAVLWLLLKKHAVSEVRNSFDCVIQHRTLRIVLSDSAVADGAECRSAVRSYFNELCREAKGLLFNPDPDGLRP